MNITGEYMRQRLRATAVALLVVAGLASSAGRQLLKTVRDQFDPAGGKVATGNGPVTRGN